MEGYTKIKNDLITSSKLDELEYRILSYMLSIQNEGKCYPSIRTMANKFMKSPTTISKYLNTLEQKGFIKKVNRILGTGKKTSNVYLINEDVISKNKELGTNIEIEDLKKENERLQCLLDEALSNFDWLGENAK